MIPLSITPDLDRNPWTDLQGGGAEPGIGRVTRVGRLTAGCVSGKSTVAIVVETQDGRKFIAETTMALFLSAARAFKAIEDEMSGNNTRN
jgi:hypothetical protein